MGVVVFASVLGFLLGLGITLGIEPLLVMLDMRMIVTPTVAALVFLGTQLLCLAASMLSFQKVAALDPAIVFRG